MFQSKTLKIISSKQLRIERKKGPRATRVLCLSESWKNRDYLMTVSQVVNFVDKVESQQSEDGVRSNSHVVGPKSSVESLIRFFGESLVSTIQNTVVLQSSVNSGGLVLQLGLDVIERQRKHSSGNSSDTRGKQVENSPVTETSLEPSTDDFERSNHSGIQQGNLQEVSLSASEQSTVSSFGSDLTDSGDGVSVVSLVSSTFIGIGLLSQKYQFERITDQSGNTTRQGHGITLVEQTHSSSGFISHDMLIQSSIKTHSNEGI
mmetsp:Transcript_64514/g.74085  ORF Transcript_64514/g.74085 Transcript_64514/m.74085 type:complete len:262 (+) Transcript_64514:139-924(+)